MKCRVFGRGVCFGLVLTAFAQTIQAFSIKPSRSLSSIASPLSTPSQPVGNILILDHLNINHEKGAAQMYEVRLSNTSYRYFLTSILQATTTGSRHFTLTFCNAPSILANKKTCKPAKRRYGPTLGHSSFTCPKENQMPKFSTVLLRWCTTTCRVCRRAIKGLESR